MEMDLDRIIQKYAENPTLAVQVHSEPVFDDAKAFTEEVLAEVASGEISEDVFQLSNHTFVEETHPAPAPQGDEAAPVEDQEVLRELAAIPDKLAFKIGEVADIVGVKQYVLRYWESEFDALKPKKSAHNQRMYSRKDVENVIMIKKLLYRDKFSIEGARKALRQLKSQVRETKKWDQVADKYDTAILQLKELKKDLAAFKQTVL